MKRKAIVSIAHGDDALKATQEAVGQRLAEMIRPGDRVLLKVNLVGGLPAETGSTVSPVLIAQVVELVKQTRAAEVGIAEDAGRFRDTMRVFHDLGAAEVAQRLGATLIDLRQHPHRLEPVPGGGLVVEAMDYALPLLEWDVLVGVTKLKTHHQAGMTAGMKNMFGAVSDDYKRRFHRSDMAAALVDINRVRTPDFTIVDGFPGMEGIGPHLGTPVPINVTVAGADTVAVDAVCASLMGFRPGWVRSVRLAGKRKLGISDLDRIEVQGVPIADVARHFKTPLEVYQEQLRDYVEIVDGGACSGCACVVATVLMLLLGRHGRSVQDLQGLRILLGKLDKSAGLGGERAFAVGHCAQKCAGQAQFIDGCAPSITDLMNAISAEDVELTSFGPGVTGRPASS